MKETSQSAVTIRHSKHLSETDLLLLDESTRMEILHNKFVIRAEDSSESNLPIEEYFAWLRDNCSNFYHVNGPHRDQNDILFYIYFASVEEAKMFKLRF